MAKLTVNDIAGLSDYGQSIKNFLENYSLAINQTYRTFERRIEGSEGTAIDAFLERLNQIQGVLFDAYPATLSEYVTHVLNYEAALSSAGFQEKAWTDDNGISSVCNHLSSQQLSEIDQVKRRLQQALNKASGALESSIFDLNPRASSTEQVLGDSSNQRLQKHQALQVAYDTFMAGLDATLEKLSRLEGQMASAIFTTHIPVATILGAIQSGALTAGEVSYLNAIRSSEDATVFKAVLGRDKEALDAVAGLEYYEISDSSYLILARYLSTWLNSNKPEDMDAINTLINGLGKKKVTSNKEFLNKLSEAVNSLALQNEINLFTILYSEEFKEDPNLLTPKISSELAYNQLMGLIHGLELIKYGQTEIRSLEWKNNLVGFKDGLEYHDVTVDLSFDDEGRLVIAMNRVNTSPELENFLKNRVTDITYVDLATNDTAFALDGHFTEYHRLDYAKKELIKNTVLNAVTSLGKTGVEFILPGSDSLMELLSSMAQNDLSGVASSITDTMGELSPKDAKVQVLQSLSGASTKATNLINSITQAASDYEKLTLEQQLEVQKIRSTYLGQGGYTISGDSAKEPTRIPGTFDYRVSLRVRELDEHGVTAFITNPDYRVGFTVEQYESELRKAVEAGQLDAQMANYLLGRDDSGLTFNTMTYEQLNSFDKAIDNLANIDIDVKEKTILGDYFKKYISYRYDNLSGSMNELGEGHD